MNFWNILGEGGTDGRIQAITHMKGAGIVQLLYRLGKGLDDRGIKVRFPTRLRDFFFSEASRPALEPTLVEGYRGLVPSG
jgi:hypothetical protein